MKLSIIIPTFNSDRTLKACLDSIVEQTYVDFEVLVMDGLSTDNTIEIVDSYCDRFPFIRCFSQKDKGIYDAINKGTECSNGEWLYVLGSDDVLFANNALEKLFILNATSIEKNDFVYGNVIWGKTGGYYDGEFDLLKLFTNNICHQSIFIRKSILTVIGNYNITYNIFADWYFNLVCFTNNKIRIKYINVIVAKFSLTGVSSENAVDLFVTNKKKLIRRLLKKQSILIKVKFELLHSIEPNIVSKIKFIYFYFIYLILVNVKMLRNRSIYQTFK